ncbi:glutaredoxin 3 [Primorskyibacter sp. S187A]|uniref:glutaredoxin 3 n=1 Tax=Primorskyibacter sp. S187A TaxID=3415130 RepID=UPI003C7C147D
MSPQVTLYTKDYCPFCKAAKSLLTGKGVRFTNFEISEDEARRREMIQRSGGRTTVPQIFIGDVHVGGYDDLAVLNSAGGLDALLRPATAA